MALRPQGPWGRSLGPGRQKRAAGASFG